MESVVDFPDYSGCIYYDSHAFENPKILISL